MPKRKIILQDGDVTKEAGFIYICAGYLVENGKVLLVLHNVFHKWVPPGGHIDAGETFAQTAEREVEEETGIAVEAVSSQFDPNPGDTDAVTDPVPFHVDVIHHFQPDAAIVQYYWVRRKASAKSAKPVAQLSEVFAVSWFDQDEIQTIDTFDQVRAVASYALSNHPDTRPAPKH